MIEKYNITLPVNIITTEQKEIGIDEEIKEQISEKK